jgi:hypothetical protein
VTDGKHSGRPNQGEPKRQGPDVSAAKRPYRTPRLAVYGSIRHLALGLGGSKSDAHGEPKSKA